LQKSIGDKTSSKGTWLHFVEKTINEHVKVLILAVQSMGNSDVSIAWQGWYRRVTTTATSGKISCEKKFADNWQAWLMRTRMKQ
jgi:hypothetical protein